jgi:hypothetical protein
MDDLGSNIAVLERKLRNLLEVRDAFFLNIIIHIKIEPIGLRIEIHESCISDVVLTEKSEWDH